MNQLNSTLLEGYLTRNPFHDEQGRLLLWLESYAFVKAANGGKRRVKHYFTVCVSRSFKNLQHLKRNLRNGDKVRVVGHLSAPTGKVEIFAEHVEYYVSEQRLVSAS